MINSRFYNKRVGILGVGMEGMAVVQFLANKGAKITLLDKLSEQELGRRASENEDLDLEKNLKNPQFTHQFGPDYLKKLDKFDIIFRSPGIPYLTAEIQQAKDRDVEISSQIKLFFDLCPCPIVGVTGTKGKGTTATLIKLMLQCNKEVTTRPNTGLDTATKKVYLAGNIGEPAITLIDKLTKDDIVVLELSSFQLQDLEKSPHIAVVLNISIDHLDYHKDEVEYKDSKISIVKYQNESDFAVINQDYLISFEYASQTDAQVYYFSGKDSIDQGAYIRKLQITNYKSQINSKFQNPNQKKELFEVILRVDGQEEVICRSDEIKLIGKHNLENIAAAAVAAKIAGANIESIKSVVKSFNGLPHRLEFVAEINGVEFYNDSFATNPAPTIAAIDSFTNPIHIILGGSSKGADFSKLASKIRLSTVRSVNLIGSESKKIASALEKAGYNRELNFLEGDINQIVKTIFSKAQKREVILLSPACASFDMFRNYKDRGEKFSRAVSNLEKRNESNS